MPSMGSQPSARAICMSATMLGQKEHNYSLEGKDMCVMCHQRMQTLSPDSCAVAFEVLMIP